MSHLHVVLLERAARKLGGPGNLCGFLGVPDVRLRLWMRGAATPPDEVFLRLVDLVHAGAHSPTGMARMDRFFTEVADNCDMGGIHLKVLRKAARVAGGDEALAQRLQVPSGDLHKWLGGEGVLPIPVFLKAIDVALEEAEEAHL